MGSDQQTPPVVPLFLSNGESGGEQEEKGEGRCGGRGTGCKGQPSV